MNNTIVQVPVSKTLRDQAASAAADLGFSSLQESIRLFMTNLAKREINITITPAKKYDEYTLSPQAAKRYEKMTRDIDSGKVKPRSFDNVDDLMEYLNQ